MRLVPTQLVPQSNLLNYVSFFTYPALSLWGEGGMIARGLYDAYQVFGIGLGDISVLSSDSVGGQGASVKWGDRSHLNFKFDRIEASVRNYLPADLGSFPEYVSRAELWLRSAVPEQQFSWRVIEVSAHSAPTGATAEDILKGLGVPDLFADAVSRSHGANYHFSFPNRQTRVDLQIDHSLQVAGGIYTHFVMIIDGDTVDYSETLAWGQTTMRALLSQVSLFFADEVR